MFGKTWSGIALTLALGWLLCNLPDPGRNAPDSTVPRVRDSAAKTDETDLAAVMRLHFADLSDGRPLRVNAPPTATEWRFPSLPVETDTGVSRPALSKGDILAMAPPVAKNPARTGARFGVSPIVLGSREGVASDVALASLAEAECPPSAGYYPGLPAKGIEIWASAEKYREMQKKRFFPDSGYYTHKGKKYSVGIKHDWSIDSTIGLSADIIDAEVQARNRDDRRKNEIDGYIGNAHYYGTVLEKYPVEAKVMYGRIDTKGKGKVYYRNSSITPWIENKHKSDLYGASGKFGVPLVFGDDFKFVPEIGVQYLKLKSKAYQYMLGDASGTVDVPKMNSTSITMPVSVTIKKDYLQCWGLVTPRLGIGLIKEFDDTATGVRVFNAPAAGYYPFDPALGAPDIVFDPTQRSFYQFTAGLDVLTNGNWDLRAEYQRHWSKKYSKNVFQVELGKCF